MSRKENSFKNAITGILKEVLINILKFVVRTVFIYTLGNSYLGINGLFTNILQMLSLAELGIATALNFRLYKPLANGDHHQICVLMKFYKNAYRVIGMIILGFGLCLIPFLKYLINDYNALEILGINPVLIYLIYLIQNACSYWFGAYKSALIKADQKEYKITLVNYVVNTISYITQIVILTSFADFTIYTSSLIFFTIIENIVNAYIVSKNYPYLKSSLTDKLKKEDIINIFNDCSVLFLYQINQVVVNATDNIVLSAFIGLTIVGKYSNYMMIYNTIKIVLIRAMDAVKNSLGNLWAVASLEKQYKFFKIMNFLISFAYGMAAVGIFVIGDSFVANWIGGDYVLGTTFCLFLGIEIYLQGSRQFVGTYRNTMGLFQYGKLRPLIQIILNVLISAALVIPLQIYGVMLGTILSDCFTWVWFDPLVIYRYGFKKHYSVGEYFLTNLKYILLTFLSAVISRYICSLIPTVNWGAIILDIFVVIIITGGVFFIFNFRTQEMRYILLQIKQVKVKLKGKVAKLR